MLGFATLDVCERTNTLTIWLTSQVEPGGVGHVNAVTFDATELDRRLAEGMLAERQVVLTQRTPADHPLIADWGIRPSDLAALGAEIVEVQAVVLDAFDAYRQLPGKSELLEPQLPPLPRPVDQAALNPQRPAELTLAVANDVQRLWSAWLATESERQKRRAYMPDGYRSKDAAVLPPRFTADTSVHPARVTRPTDPAGSRDSAALAASKAVASS